MTSSVKRAIALGRLRQVPPQLLLRRRRVRDRKAKTENKCCRADWAKFSGSHHDTSDGRVAPNNQGNVTILWRRRRSLHPPKAKGPARWDEASKLVQPAGVYASADSALAISFLIFRALADSSVSFALARYPSSPPR